MRSAAVFFLFHMWFTSFLHQIWNLQHIGTLSVPLLPHLCTRQHVRPHAATACPLCMIWSFVFLFVCLCVVSFLEVVFKRCSTVRYIRSVEKIINRFPCFFIEDKASLWWWPRVTWNQVFSEFWVDKYIHAWNSLGSVSNNINITQPSLLHIVLAGVKLLTFVQGGLFDDVVFRRDSRGGCVGHVASVNLGADTKSKWQQLYHTRSWSNNLVATNWI